MRKITKTQAAVLVTAFLFVFIFIASAFVHEADARSRRGGRSFSRSRTFQKTPQRANPSNPRRNLNSPFGGSSFMRGLGGGLLGGFLGSMLFGGVGHGMGMGGFGRERHRSV